MDVSVQTVWINTPENVYCQELDDEKMNAEILSVLKNLEYRDAVKGLSPLVADVQTFDLDEEPWITLKKHVDKLAKIALIEDNNKNPHTRYRSKKKVWTERWHDTLQTISMWAVKYNGVKSDHAKLHDHFPALYTFCYYVEDPEEENYLLPPLFIGSKIGQGGFSVDVKNGRLVLFRGDVDHGTVMQKFQGTRYCIGGSIHHIMSDEKFNIGPILPSKED